MSLRIPLEARRERSGPLASSDTDGANGAFCLESPISGWYLAIVASDGSWWGEAGLPGEPWEHVSVHAFRGGGTKQRCPTWSEMAYIKRLFWAAEDIVTQYHPADSKYVNVHSFTLHLWRPTATNVPTPPVECV